ncbi:hypothetical protein CN311_00775 [Mesorhizobium sanjuanii]|uniref:DUF3606 domain-containing protein n=1 Tax=Mesorhizobium sanjuanii TaxID=2037900 RepID=A0A2A6FMQ6_9HYPH|nr:hypothetical protein [Mesorhizobium sanjuanii]PDQ23022.1 hypothetical protein CN311_00775 [Mesorhizobium sanjuanii]
MVEKAAAGRKSEHIDKDALHLAETTDVSPRQARELLQKHDGDRKKAAKEAKNFKAEG